MPRSLEQFHSITALILTAAVCITPPLRAQQPRPNGAWQLDTSRSDSLPTRIGPAGPPTPRDDGEQPGGAPGYGPPGAGGMSGQGGPDGEIAGGRRFGGGRYGRKINEKDLARIKQTLDLGRHSAVRVRIDPDSGLFTRIDADGSTEQWKIGGGTATEPAVDGGAIKTRVRWKGDALIVERKVDGGGKVTESFGLGLDGSRLIDFVEVLLGPVPTTFTRQYVRDEGAEAP